jgi:hypothetical protein
MFTPSKAGLPEIHQTIYSWWSEPIFHLQCNHGPKTLLVLLASFVKAFWCNTILTWLLLGAVAYNSFCEHVTDANSLSVMDLPFHRTSRLFVFDMCRYIEVAAAATAIKRFESNSTVYQSNFWVHWRRTSYQWLLEIPSRDSTIVHSKWFDRAHGWYWSVEVEWILCTQMVGTRQAWL